MFTLSTHARWVNCFDLPVPVLSPRAEDYWLTGLDGMLEYFEEQHDLTLDDLQSHHHQHDQLQAEIPRQPVMPPMSLVSESPSNNHINTLTRRLEATEADGKVEVEVYSDLV